jgi:succinyl-CoA synthetase beta subunit
MWNCYVNFDATLVEINPLAKITTADNSTAVYALDAKISLDENAKFRHDEYFNEFADEAASDPLERRAGELGLNYVRLDGEIGVIGNGAGLVMSSLDVVKLAGEEFGGVKPANFLDIGGGASSEVMKNSLELVTSDPNVQAILVNIFGGLTQCDLVAEGILQAMHALENESVVLKQIVVRFDGNARDAGVKILQQANRPEIEVTTSMKDAAERVAKRAWQKQTSAQNQAKEVQS